MQPPVCRGRPGDGAVYDSLSKSDQDAVTRVVINVGKALGAYLRSITRTQTALNFIQDVDTARTLLTELAGTDAALCRAAGFVCGWHGPRYRKLSRKTMRKLKRLLWSPAPWQAPPR